MTRNCFLMTAAPLRPVRDDVALIAGADATPTVKATANYVEFEGDVHALVAAALGEGYRTLLFAGNCTARAPVQLAIPDPVHIEALPGATLIADLVISVAGGPIRLDAAIDGTVADDFGRVRRPLFLHGAPSEGQSVVWSETATALVPPDTSIPAPTPAPRDENFAAIKTWTSTKSFADWSGYPTNAPPYAAHAFHWANYAMEADDNLETTMSIGDISGTVDLRTTANLTLGWGGVKGSPTIWIGKHDNRQSPDNPLLTGADAGFWSNALSSLKISARVIDHGSAVDASYWAAIQLYGFRTKYTGDTRDGVPWIDIQIRFFTHGENTIYGNDVDAVTDTLRVAGIDWSIRRKLKGGDDTSYLAFPTNYDWQELLTDFDVKALVDVMVARDNAVLGGSLAGFWLWGVEVWHEPRGGVIDTSLRDFVVEVDSVRYQPG